MIWTIEEEKPWEKIVDKIEDVRSKNNTVWMDIVRVAIEANPGTVRNLLREIEENDREVTRLCRLLQKSIPD